MGSKCPTEQVGRKSYEGIVGSAAALALLTARAGARHRLGLLGHPETASSIAKLIVLAFWLGLLVLGNALGRVLGL